MIDHAWSVGKNDSWQKAAQETLWESTNVHLELQEGRGKTLAPKAKGWRYGQHAVINTSVISTFPVSWNTRLFTKLARCQLLITLTTPPTYTQFDFKTQRTVGWHDTWCSLPHPPTRGHRQAVGVDWKLLGRFLLFNPWAGSGAGASQVAAAAPPCCLQLSPAPAPYSLWSV